MSTTDFCSLLCLERISQEDLCPSSHLYSDVDPVILKDGKILDNLLKIEMNYLPSPNFISFVQKEIKEHMRRIVIEWMLEVCEEQECHEKVFPLAVNSLDRFLSLVPISSSQLQLLGTVCLFVCSKACESVPLTGQTLVFYTDYSITLQELQLWEVLVLTRLKWDILAITPIDFLDFLVDRLPEKSISNTRILRQNAKCFVLLCLKDYRFCLQTPSTVATAAVAVAARAMLWHQLSSSSVYDGICDTLRESVGLEADIFSSAVAEIENLVTSQLKSQQLASSRAVETMVTSKHEETGTPTDVQDVKF